MTWLHYFDVKTGARLARQGGKLDVSAILNAAVGKVAPGIDQILVIKKGERSHHNFRLVYSTIPRHYNQLRLF
jgi:hypothetical protein